jgi:flagellar hook-associated protein 3 FlgL
MRVTFNTFPDTLLGRLQSLGSEQNKALTQLSTGQRIAAPSDDAPAMQRILNLRTEKKQNQQFYRNATDGLEKSKVTFSSLEQIKDLFVRSSELAANVSGATSEQEYKAKASEINQLIEQGLNVANTKLRGNYLFSGDSNSIIPFKEQRPNGRISSSFRRINMVRLSWKKVSAETLASQISQSPETDKMAGRRTKCKRFRK